VLVPALVTRLWDRRLALGRALPATRDRISWQLIQGAVRDTKVLLGSVAGAAAGRSGAPTPATAQLLVHQAALIAAIGAVYGADIEDKRALFARVTPHLTATLALDVAESQLSKLAKALPGGDKKGNLYATAAAVVARPTLSVTSTLVAGFAARRVFRGGAGEPSAIARAAARTRDLGKRAAGGVGQSATAAASVLAARVRRREAEPAHEAASSAAPDPGPPPDHATAPDVVVGQADEQAEDRAS
jgi:hypothetical protein